MEEEIWNGKCQEIAGSRELQLAAWKRHHHFLLLGSVKGTLLHFFQDIEGLGDAFLELGKCCFVVFHGHGFDTGDTNKRVLGCVAGALDLEAKGLHVVNEAGLCELGLFEALFFGILLSLVEDMRERREATNEDGHADIVERDRHSCGDVFDKWVTFEWKLR